MANDLLWRHLKLAGILIELAGDVMGPTVAVIGIGINSALAGFGEGAHRSACRRPGKKSA
jgi:biotin-(acetyl-CoA carboxylase) ligase